MIQPLNLPEPKARCSAMHPERGTQCGLPLDHIGQHQNGTLCAPWSEQIPTYVIDASELAEGRATAIKLKIEGKERFDKMHAELTQNISEELGRQAAATIEQAFQNQKDAAP